MVKQLTKDGFFYPSTRSECPSTVKVIILQYNSWDKKNLCGVLCEARVHLRFAGYNSIQNYWLISHCFEIHTTIQREWIMSARQQVWFQRFRGLSVNHKWSDLDKTRLLFSANHWTREQLWLLDFFRSLWCLAVNHRWSALVKTHGNVREPSFSHCAKNSEWTEIWTSK